MPHDPLIRKGLAEEIVGAYRALAHLHRAVIQCSADDNEIALHDAQSDILDREAQLWNLRLRDAKRRAAE